MLVPINYVSTESINALEGAITIAGTANQVIVTPAGTTITLSLPQSIATSSTPTFGGMTLNGTTAFTAASPFSVANGQTLTFSTTAQTVGGATLTIPNFAGVNDTICFVTLAQTLANKTLTSPTINGATLTGTLAGAITFSSTIAFTAANPFSIANGQTLTVSTTAQTVGGATLTVPNFAGVNDTFAFLTLAQTLANKTLTSPTINGASLTGTFSGSATFTGTNTWNGAIVGQTYGGTGLNTSAVTNGQLLIGNTTGNVFALATLTGTASQITVTNGASSITLATPQNIATTSSPTFAALTLTAALTVPNGGTGAGAFTANGVLYGNGAAALQVTAQGALGSVLHGNGGAPAFSAVSLTVDVSGVLPIANGGTALSTTPTDGQLLVGKTATNAYVQATLTGTANQVTVTNGSGTITLATPQSIATTSTPQFSRLGLGAAADAVHLLLLSGGTVTADTHLIDGAITWNAGAVTFTGYKLNVTDTASAAGSLLIDLQKGGTSQLNCTKAGALTITGAMKHGDTVLIHTTTALANGAGVATATFTNAPSATNPSKWIPIDDNGTTRYIPAF